MSISNELDRAAIIDANFVNRVQTNDLPHVLSQVDAATAGLNKQQCISLFKSQLMSRQLDNVARELRAKQQSFYTIGSSGHESNAAIAMAFNIQDIAFLHYRSCAFMLQRAKQNNEDNAVLDHLLAFVAAKSDPIAGGRHKVFGSLSLNVPPQTSTIASHAPKALGAALAINSKKALKINGQGKEQVVLCSFGDASFNHSTTQGALNACAWIVNQGIPLPMVWICEDNGIGISQPTPNDWVANRMLNNPFIEYIPCDGRDFLAVYEASRRAEQIARVNKKPVFLHMQTIRLMGHAGSDIELQYREKQAVEASEAQDPLLFSAQIMLKEGFLNQEDIVDCYREAKQEIQELLPKVLAEPKLDNSQDIMATIIPPKVIDWQAPARVTLEQRQALLGKQFKLSQQKRSMAQSINLALHDCLLQYPNSVIFGEDVGKKGGVYHVTADLQQRFGRKRVFDTILDEQTILGTAIGMAQQGLLPIPEIQFMAYIHNAEDQIRGEAATLSFFSQGQFTNPMLLRLPGLAYQKGFGGHFHNDNAFGFLREIPGVVIACPASPQDGALLLKESLRLVSEQQRVVVFIEPIALYATKDLHQEGDGEYLQLYPEQESRLVFGEPGYYGEGEDCLIITYGNGCYLSRQAQAELATQNIKTTVMDLRWLAPLNEQAIVEQAKQFKHILIVDECRQTGSLSEALVTLLVEQLSTLPRIKRICAKDCFIPLGAAAQLVLPSKQDIVTTVANMLGEKNV